MCVAVLFFVVALRPSPTTCPPVFLPIVSPISIMLFDIHILRLRTLGHEIKSTHLALDSETLKTSQLNEEASVATSF